MNSGTLCPFLKNLTKEVGHDEKENIYVDCWFVFGIISDIKCRYTHGRSKGLWYTWWDSALGDFAAKAADDSVEELFAEVYLPLEMRSDPNQGKGILGGPMISYQTDDGLWSMSLAWMGFSDFSQDADLSATLWGYTYNGKYNLELDRSEIDFAISRNVSERFKIFLGYKYQKLEYEYDFSDADGTLPVYKAEATMTMPSVGVSYVHPFLNNMFVGLQGGLLLVNGFIGYRELLWPIEGFGGYENFDTTVGFNGELSLSYMITQKIMLQCGYRLQSIKLKADFGEGLKLDDTDTVHGFFLTTLYMFDL